MVLQQPTDGPKLVGAPSWIELGGSRVQVLFDMESFVYIEERWGSLKAYWEELQKGQEGRMYTAVRDGIAAAVRDLPVSSASLMDPALVVEYANALLPAFMKAMPSVVQEAAAEAQAREADRPLTGDGSSTSVSSASGWHPPTSGA